MLFESCEWSKKEQKYDKINDLYRCLDIGSIYDRNLPIEHEFFGQTGLEYIVIA